MGVKPGFWIYVLNVDAEFVFGSVQIDVVYLVNRLLKKAF